MIADAVSPSNSLYPPGLDPGNAPISNAEEADVEWFYKDLQDLLELTPKKDVLLL